MQDRAPSHESKYSTAWLASKGLQVDGIMTWPPSSPDLNPIENVWTLLKCEIYSEGRQYTGRLWLLLQRKLLDSMDGNYWKEGWLYRSLNIFKRPFNCHFVLFVTLTLRIELPNNCAHLYVPLRQIKLTFPLLNIQVWGSVTFWIDWEHCICSKIPISSEKKNCLIIVHAVYVWVCVLV